MSLVEERTFSKVGSLYCRCEWGQEEMSLTVLHCHSAWTARLDTTNLNLGPRAGQQDLMTSLREAFSGDSENFSISLENENDKLVWKRIQGKTKVMLTEIALTRISFSEAQTSFNEQLITENKDLKKTNNSLKVGHETLLRDNKMSKKMLEEFENDRKEIEDKLYARFLPILNAKKAHIQELLNCGEENGETDIEDDMEEEVTKRGRFDD